MAAPLTSAEIDITSFGGNRLFSSTCLSEKKDYKIFMFICLVFIRMSFAAETFVGLLD